MIFALARAVAIYAISWFVWRLFKNFVVRSPLDNVPGPPSRSLLFGNIPQLFDPVGWDFHFRMLANYHRVIRITGALGERLLLTVDPKALHHILVKDQDIYEESSAFLTRNAVYFGEGLIATLGQQHRKQRKMMNPVFSINHMRAMIPIFYEVAERLRTVLVTKVKDGPREIDILHWMTRTALELIGQSGMGYSFDSLTGDHDYHPYSKSVKRLGPLSGGPRGFFVGQFVYPLASKFNFPRLKRFIVDRIPWTYVQELREVTRVIHKTSSEIIEAKKAAMNSDDPEVVMEMMNKKDIISILMRANASASEEDRMSDEEVRGQVSTFVFAGMDTTSSALSRILHLLAQHPHVQENLREEIKEAQKQGKLEYDQLVSLPYLDAVCRETLRVYPPANMAAMRTVRKDMVLPLSKPITGVDGKEITEIFVQNGTNILISVLGANRNPDLWGPDAHEWKPERWLSPLPKAVGEAHMPGIYSHLMTFLGGSRACIGFKFSQLEMKVVLSVLLSTFAFSLSEKHEITWKMAGVAGPYIENIDRTRPQLPLIMSLVN